MKIRNIIFMLAIVFIFYGCTVGPATYEVFEKNRNYLIGGPWLPDKEDREVYSEDKYIYKMEIHKGCYIGFFTNRDNKPERIIGWIILLGKEYCKERQGYGF